MKYGSEGDRAKGQLVVLEVPHDCVGRIEKDQHRVLCEMQGCGDPEDGWTLIAVGVVE